MEERIPWALKQERTEPLHLVYEAKDFEEILDEINALMARVMTFTVECMKLNEPPTDEAGLTGA